MEPGDRIVLYLTGEACARSASGELFEDRAVWPGKPAGRPYPWRFEASRAVLEEEWLPPSGQGRPRVDPQVAAEHWTLAFQGQLRTVSEPTRRPARGDAGARRRASGGEPRRTLRALPPESRLTGGAAAALIFSMVLPWYQVSSIGKADSRSAFQVFTWVEAAILLVAPAVLYLVWARAQRQALPPAGRRRLHRLAGGRLGARAAGLAAVRQARRSAGRRRPSASSGASSSRCWPRARWWRRARGCAPPGGPSRPTRSPRSPSGRSRSAARRERAATAARASTPRSRRCCASARRRGRASRREAPGRAEQPRPSGRRSPDEPPPPPDRLF